jgi:tRNA(His) guanylyltransferase
MPEKSRFDAMGDRMKMYEMREAGHKLMPGLPVLVRLDGRSFHTFTRGLKRPFDMELRAAMDETAKYLVHETHAAVAYTQSDEISLAFPNIDPDAQLMFDGRSQKLCSVLAAMATAKFNQEIMRRIPSHAHKLPLFDARVWQVPTLDLALEAFAWREADATKNSITMYASAFYSHKELHKKSSRDKHEMLHAKGVNWNDLDAALKRGVYFRRENVIKELSPAELARIPEKHRPTGPVTRSEIRAIDMPPINQVANAKDVLFFGAAPVKAIAVVPVAEAA